MIKLGVFFSIAASVVLSSAAMAFTQLEHDGLTEEQSSQSEIIIQDESDRADSDQLPEPLKSHADSIRSAEVEQNIVDRDDEEETETVVLKSDLLAEGKTKKTTGAALTGIGGFFMGGALVYTVLFLKDQPTFGIYLGSSSRGYYRTEYYLNPGIFAISIGAPCLALGIVNLIKGKNMISDAIGTTDDDDSAAPFKMVPYVYYQSKVRGYGGGLVATF